MSYKAHELGRLRHMPAMGSNDDKPEKLPPEQREKKLMHATEMYAFLYWIPSCKIFLFDRVR